MSGMLTIDVTWGGCCRELSNQRGRHQPRAEERRQTDSTRSRGCQGTTTPFVPI